MVQWWLYHGNLLDRLYHNLHGISNNTMTLPLYSRWPKKKPWYLFVQQRQQIIAVTSYVHYTVQYVTLRCILHCITGWKIASLENRSPYRINTARISCAVRGDDQWRTVTLPGFAKQTAMLLYLILSAVVQFPVLGLKQARNSTRISACGDKMLTLINKARAPASTRTMVYSLDLTLLIPCCHVRDQPT